MKKNIFVLFTAMTASLLSASDSMVDHSFGHSAAENVLIPSLQIFFDGKADISINKYNLKCTKNTLKDFVAFPSEKRKSAIIDNEHFMQFTSQVPFIRRKGTIVFRCRPLNWNGYSQGAAVFATLSGTGKKGTEGALNIHVDSRKPKNLFVAVSRKNGFAEIVPKVSKIGAIYPVTEWKDKFYHVAYAFDNQKMTLYIDGKKVTSVNADIYRTPEALDTLTVGGFVPPWCGRNKGNRTALEEFAVYDKALNADEIAALAKNTNASESRGQLKSVSLMEIPLRRNFDFAKEINPDDENWKTANLYCGFFDNSRRSFAARQTDVAMFYDSKGMYFLFDTPSDGREDVFTLILRSNDAPARRFVTYALSDGFQVKKISCKGRDFVQCFVSFNALKTNCPKVKTSWKWNILCSNGKENVSLIPLWDPTAPWNELELGTLRFTTETAPIVRMNNIRNIDGNGKFSFDITFRAGDESGKLFVFADTFKNGVMSRSAHSDLCYEDRLNSWTLHSDKVGAGNLKNFDKVGLQMVNRKFNVMYYRSEFFPYKTPPPFTAPKISLQKNSNAVSAVTDCSGMPFELIRSGKLVFSLIVDGKKIEEYNVEKIMPEVEAKFSLAKLVPAKKYSIMIELFEKNGKKIHSDFSENIFPDVSVWLNNKFGYSDKVPAPFEDIKIEKKQFYCWNRCYDFSNGALFPKQVTSRGRELLAAPIAIQLVSGGKMLDFKVDKWEIVRKSVTEADYRATAKANDIEIEVKGHLEYDGMLFFNVVLKSKRKITVDEMNVVFPFKKECSELFAFTESTGAGQGSKHYYGRTPEKKTSYPFLPFFWIGDKDRGMLIFSESAENWFRSAPEKAVSVEKTADNVRLAYHIIGRKTALDGKKEISFGIQASPVRPRPQKWRELETRYTFVPTNMKYFAYVPNASDAALKVLERAKNTNKLTSAYSFLNNVSTSLAEYNLFFDDWKREESQKKGEFYLDVVAPNIKSWQDFAVYSYVLGMQKYGLNGIYYDLAWPTPSKNLRHGGFINEFGKPEAKWPIFAARTIAKRAYTEFRKHNKETVFTGHVSSNAIVMPITAFCDLLLEGEQYAGILYSYIEQIPEERALTEFTGRQFGSPILFLPELAKSGNANYSNKTPEPTIEMVSICYLYDMLIWPLFCHSGTYAKFRAPHTKFVKNSDVEFLPYWEKNHGISASNPNIKISVYRKKGELLAAVVNLSANSENTKVVIPGKYSSVKDAVSGEKISLDNINVSAKSLRLLLFKE